MYSALYRIEYEKFTNEASRQGVRTLLKFSSLMMEHPKENFKAYKSRKESGTKTNDLNADTILNGL
jgi:hypothetical protein